jgi:hypothetical protein
MPDAALHSPESDYLSAVDRTEGLARLRAQARKRKSMLVFGPKDVGKTRLLLAFAQTQPFALYVPRIRSPRDLMLSLVRTLRGLEEREIRLPASEGSLSTPSLKGIVQRALEARPFLLVLDHLAGPSRVVTGVIKELADYGRRPIFFAARTPHMEDIGTLQPMCADRSERLEIRNFTPAIALEFAKREAARSGLRSSNLESALHSLVDWSEGNPGSILQMLKMAKAPRYRIGDQIKAHVLYLDFRMGRRD